MSDPVNVAPIRMTSLRGTISSALAVRSPMANGTTTHNATSTSKAPNLKKLRFPFESFIFITFFIRLICEPSLKKRGSLQFGSAKSQCEDVGQKDRREIKTTFE